MAWTGYIFFSFLALIAALLLYPSPPLSKNALNWQKKGQYMTLRGHRVFFIDEEGLEEDGGTLLIYHGFPTSSYDWIKVLEGLKRQFNRVIIYDMLGYGFSDKPTYHKYSIFEQADIGEAILDYLDISRVHLLAHDYGDTVALETVARFNQRETNKTILSLCLSNGGIFPETNHPLPIQKVLTLPLLGDIITRFSFYPIFKISLGRVFGPRTQPTEEEFWDFHTIKSYKNGHLVNHKLLNYIQERLENKERWVGALQDTKVKVHMIYGPLDPVNPSEFEHFYRKTVPQHSITVLDSHISHYPQWEAPSEFLAAYIPFIKSLST